MTVWEAILLGVVQGLTEFLPISSTAHLVVVRKWLEHPTPNDAFTTAIQLGTLIAVVLYFRKDIIRLLQAFLHDRFAFAPNASSDSVLCWKIVVGTIPAVVVGLLAKDFIKERLYTLQVMGLAAIFFALLMLVAELIAYRRQQRGTLGRNEGDIRWMDALFIGCFQAFALIPGGSRSGCTITAALIIGLARPTAARFSFLISLPTILGAGLYESYSERHELFAAQSQLTNLLIGSLVAALVGYLSIAWLLKFLRTHSMSVFVGYRIGLGALLLYLSYRYAI
ncbi:MAG: undecaprenyl-diphosphatase UppP [Zavarzinella sp.]